MVSTPAWLSSSCCVLLTCWASEAAEEFARPVSNSQVELDLGHTLSGLPRGLGLGDHHHGV